MSRSVATWVNGAFVAPGAASIAPADRGFTLGDGAFETLLVREGWCLRWDSHMERLGKALWLLGIALPYPLEALRAAAAECAAAAGGPQCAVRISVSRGPAVERGLLPAGTEAPTVAIEARAYAGYPEEMRKRGMHLATSQLRRNEHTPLARVKSLSNLQNVLARMESQELGADEALVLNTGGSIAGASAANLFAVFEREVVTPPVADGALPGTVRWLVGDEFVPACGLEVREEPLWPGPLFRAYSEVFLTNALMGVMPVTRIDGEPVGDGLPGPVTAQIAAALAAHEANELAGVKGLRKPLL